MAPGTWWDSAYRSGHIPWDPGLFDAHLPAILERYGIGPCPVLDIGCGTGKSLIWLAGQGFVGTGIDLAPTALGQARTMAARRGVTCRWLHGAFPADFPPRVLPDGSYGFIMERGCFQHLRSGRKEAGAFAQRVAGLLAPGGVYYSLIAADRGRQRGYATWSQREVRDVLGKVLVFEELELSVFTPGETGSMGAWRCVLRRGAGPALSP